MYRNKNTVVVLIIFLVTFNAFSESKTRKYLNVMNKDGLSIYNNDMLSGESIGNIEYGSKVEKISEFKMIEKDKFKGKICKIIYNGNEGYVFGGFLSELPIPENVKDFKEYIKKNFKKIGGNSKEKGTHSFEKGIKISFSSNYESKSETYIFSNASLEEVYLIFISLSYEGISNLEFDPKLDDDKLRYFYLSGEVNNQSYMLQIQEKTKSKVEVNLQWMP